MSLQAFVVPPAFTLRTPSPVLCPKMSVATPPLPKTTTLYIKGQPTSSGLIRGACPFSAKAMLALRLKNVPYTEHWIDFASKPPWYLALNPAGTVPTLVASDAEVVPSSDEIVALADEAPGPRLYREESAFWDGAGKIIAPVFGAFAAVMKATDDSGREEGKTKLGEALRGVEEFLGESGGPYLLGEEISAMDVNLAPKLQHLVVAGGKFRGVGLAEYPRLARFYETVCQRVEWTETAPGEEAVIEGWAVYT